MSDLSISAESERIIKQVEASLHNLVFGAPGEFEDWLEKASAATDPDLKAAYLAMAEGDYTEDDDE